MDFNFFMIYKILMPFVFILAPLFSFWALAYIPSSEMIFKRLNANKGSGWHRIEQELRFFNNPQAEPFMKLKEVWFKGPRRLFVQVTSPSDENLSLRFSYGPTGKTWVNKKNKRVKKIGNFIEPFFSLTDYFPSWIAAEQKAELSRAMGVSNYRFQSKKRILWIEQDAFVIRKILLIEKGVFTAEDYKSRSGGLLFPDQRKFFIHEEDIHVIEAHTKDVKLLKATPKIKLTKNNWGKFSEDPESMDKQWIKRFYRGIR